MKVQNDKIRDESLQLREDIQSLNTQIKKMSDNIILVNEYKAYVENAQNLSKLKKNAIL